MNLINFLQHEFETNERQYRTLNSYRSAVSATLGTCARNGRPVGQDPLVCRFLRGVHRLRPPKTKLFPNWDILQVVNYLKTWGKVKDLSLKQLLMKTSFLVALVCYKRPSDLINMDVKTDYWQLSRDGFVCQPLGYGKTECHNPTPPIKIDPFRGNPELCPVQHLLQLEGKLRHLRSDTVTRFWLSAKAPHKPITVQTMSRWLKEVIKGAGSMTGMARDVRSVGATLAVQTNFDMKQILEAGNWQRLSTLQRYYFKPQPLNSLSSILRIAQ